MRGMNRRELFMGFGSLCAALLARRARAVAAGSIPPPLRLHASKW